MNKSFKKISALFIVMLLVFSMISSTSLVTASAYTAEEKGEITFNKELYDNNKAVCDKIAEGLQNFEKEINVSEFKLTSQDLRDIMKTVIRKHPEIFYVDLSFGVGTDGTYALVIVPTYIGDSATIAEQSKALEEEAKKYTDKIDSSMSEFKKAVILHDELALNCKYLNEGSDGHVTAYDALVKGAANCQGYSSAYSYLLSLVGVSSEFVESSAMYHVWNKVCIDGEYYNVDLTWDDPVPNKEGHVGHNYFLLSDAKISSGDDEIAKHYGFDYESFKSTSTKYDNYMYREFDTKFCYIGDDCYVIDNKYKSNFEKCLLKYNSDTDTAELVERFDYKWMSGATSYWQGGFMSLDVYNGKLYFNSPDCIYTYDVNTKTSQRFSEDNTLSGDYYGMIIKNGDVYALLSENPNTEGTLKYIDSISGALLGDADLNGIVQVIDATLIQKYCASLEEFTSEQFDVSDFNGDGVVNVQDATEIQKYLAGIL